MTATQRPVREKENWQSILRRRVMLLRWPLLIVGGIIGTGFSRFQRMQQKIDGLNSTVQENVTNMRVVKSFVREEHETEKFKETGDRLGIFDNSTQTACVDRTDNNDH